MDLCVTQMIICLKDLDEEVYNNDNPPNHCYDEEVKTAHCFTMDFKMYHNCLRNTNTPNAH